MNVILGSGIVGSIAKTVYPDYKIIPFKKSRYYSFEIPLADNFIKCDKDIDDYMYKISDKNKIPLLYKLGMSFEGQLIFTDVLDIKRMYLEKVYGEFEEYQEQLIQNTFSIYSMDIISLYQLLQNSIKNDINESIEVHGDLVRININTHTLIFKNGSELKYDNLISTIPLDALYSLCHIKHELKAKSVCYYLISSKSVNLEGAETVLVADKHIEFFKVVKLKEGYLFWTFDRVEVPYQYFGSFLNYNIEIIDSSRVDNVIPVGKVDISELEKVGVFPVGSNAQWDDWMDCASCIKRLLRLRNKNIGG